MPAPTSSTELGPVFDEHRPFLWALCYRLCGTAADADDLVQETFVRALQHPPARTHEPWRPWLVRVAVNLGKDLLRRRRVRGYDGPWLPAPLEAGGEDLGIAKDLSPSARYEALESATLAFLLALEALTPQQRAVLLLRDVFDYSVRETAAALTLTEVNVKTTHGRARKRMATCDAQRRRPDPALQEQTAAALFAFLGALQAGDVASVEALLAADVRALGDGGGEFNAARKPVVGAAKVARLLLGLARHPPTAADVRLLSGLPAVVLTLPHIGAGWAPRAVVQVEIGEDGRITGVHSILATRKLSHVRFPNAARA